MPNIKSAEKRVRTSKIREMRNKSNRTRLKTTLKRFDAAVTGGNRAEADSAYKVAVKTVDKAVSKGLLHKNNAARKKSSLTRRLDNMA
ncbi:MAG: 30S ribosomal protein S20 [Oscillospiraceae bacterium]|nr:30S ribosomal protein S20 [Oscillospiraceae bacterium]